MKIAVPYENGMVYPHLDKAACFKIYDVLDDEILSEEIKETASAEADSASLAAFLKEQGISLVICGRLAIQTVIALQKAAIQIMGGASGEADQRVEDFLGGALHFDRGGGCASCASAGTCSVVIKDDETGNADSSLEECDGNISACGHWCH